MHKWGIALTLTACLAGPAFAQLKELKPGFNLFSKEQDIQLGREAAAQVEQQQPIVRNQEITDYLNRIGQRLANTPHAKTGFQFTFKAVNDKNINAFALPGGPIFVNTGLLQAAENEAQVAGVLAHEMSHVVLRHGTAEATKANFIQIPALLAGAMVGNGSLLGQLTQVGIGLGANSILLRNSRSAESQADYNGTRIMAEADYNPLEMARFFEKLQAKGGKESTLTQFLSDHPNPGNRIKSVEDEIRYLPQSNYTIGDTTRLKQLQSVVAGMPAPPKPSPAGAATPPATPPSARFREYQGREFAISYPDNWQEFGDQQSAVVTLAPKEGLVSTGPGQTAIGYGATASFFVPQTMPVDLRRDTNELIRQFQSRDQGMSVSAAPRSISFAGQTGLLTTLNSASPYKGDTEIDVLATAARSDGLFYIVFVAPKTQYNSIEPVFEQMLKSVRFPN